MVAKGKKSSKNPPILSHEFVIQNHADIIACVAMVFIVGLMFQATSSFASKFVTLQHNVSTTDASGSSLTVYTAGPKDILAAFFYFLIVIIGHAVIQEFVLDKINRKLHLSKVKHSKFNESGQLLVFYAVSTVWATHVAWEEKWLLNISSLWSEYPHLTMSFISKFFFIIQFAYWLHVFPEIYLQKTKKEEIPARIRYGILYLVFIGAAYLLNFTPLATVLLALHFLVESVFHFAKLLYFLEKKEAAGPAFMLWNGLFIVARLLTVILSVVTFWFGLGRSKGTNPAPDFAAGDFNTPFVRVVCLVAVGFSQVWMMWNYTLFQLKRKKIKDEESAAAKRLAAPKKAPKKSNKGSEGDAAQVNGDAKKKTN